MSEFCKDCFLKLNPQFEEKDLVMIKGGELCEGCGKIVNEVVWEVKEKSERKFNENEKQEKFNRTKTYVK